MPSMKGFRNKISRVYQARRKINAVSACDLEQILPLMDLSDDLILHILSFVSYAPFEPSEEDLYWDYVFATTGKYRSRPTKFSPFQPSSHNQAALKRGSNQPRLMPSSFGTLTHVFPLVCHRFANLCLLSDELWKQAMLRLAVASPSVWEDGLTQLSCEYDSSGKDALDEVSLANDGRAKKVFQRIVEVHQPFTSTQPLFILGGAEVPSPAQAWNLHLFEPRYRLMISEIMRGRSIKDKSGHCIPPPGRPRFLLSSGISVPLTEQDPVFMAEVVRCELKRDGRAFITILPTNVTRIQNVQVRPNSSGLLEATVRRETAVREKRRLPVLASSTSMFFPSLYSSMELFVGEEVYRRSIDPLMGTSSNTADLRPRLILAHIASLVEGEPAFLMEIRRSLARPGGGGHVLDVIAIGRGRLHDSIEHFDEVRSCDAFIDLET